MSKITLNLDALQVESFDTAPEAAPGRGTVKGNMLPYPQTDNISCYATDCGGGTCESCYGSCNDTCWATCPATCVQSCYGTCPGQNTCGYTCECTCTCCCCASCEGTCAGDSCDICGGTAYKEICYY